MFSHPAYEKPTFVISDSRGKKWWSASTSNPSYIDSCGNQTYPLHLGAGAVPQNAYIIDTWIPDEGAYIKAVRTINGDMESILDFEAQLLGYSSQNGLQAQIITPLSKNGTISLLLLTAMSTDILSIINHKELMHVPGTQTDPRLLPIIAERLWLQLNNLTSKGNHSARQKIALRQLISTVKLLIAPPINLFKNPWKQLKEDIETVQTAFSALTANTENNTTCPSPTDISGMMQFLSRQSSPEGNKTVATSHFKEYTLFGESKWNPAESLDRLVSSTKSV